MNRWYDESPLAAVANGMRAAWRDLRACGAWFLSDEAEYVGERLVLAFCLVALVAVACGWLR